MRFAKVLACEVGGVSPIVGAKSDKARTFLTVLGIGKFLTAKYIEWIGGEAVAADYEAKNF